MRTQWHTFATLIRGRTEPAPGAKKTIEEVRMLQSVGRLVTRQTKDGSMTVLQYAETK